MSEILWEIENLRSSNKQLKDKISLLDQQASDWKLQAETFVKELKALRAQRDELVELLKSWLEYRGDIYHHQWLSRDTSEAITKADEA